MKEHVLAFAVAFVVCAIVFLGLDYSIMKMMGLSLIYQP